MHTLTKKYKSLLGLKEMKRNVLFGIYKDYEITIYCKTKARCLISFYASDEVKYKLIEELSDPSDNGYFKYKQDMLGIEISVISFSSAKSMKLLMSKVDTLLLRLHEIMVKYNCVASGGYDYDGTEKIKIVNKRYITLNNKGIDLLVYKKEDSQRNLNAIPPHYTLGILGILLGIFISYVIWFTLDIARFFSPVAFAFSVIFGDMLYIKLGARDDKNKLIMEGILPIALVMILTFITYLLYALFFVNHNALDISPIEFLMTDYSLRATFISRLILNPIFTLIGFGLISSTYYHKYKSHRIKISDLPEKKKEENPEA